MTKFIEETAEQHAANILEANKRIARYLQPTPLVKAELLSQQLQAQVYLKLENLQPTNTFKVRGAFSKLLSLSDTEKKQDIIAASTGNHGAAVAYAGKMLNIPVTVYVPISAVATKLENIQRYGANIITVGNECVDSEAAAKEAASTENKIYVPPYNDAEIINGQGTIAVELFEQLDQIDTIYVPVGGGGLISGIAAYTKAKSPSTTIVGCLPENSPVLSESIKAGKIIEVQIKPTLSDATAGNLEQGSITFDLCQQFVDDYQIASEDQIKHALKTLFEQNKLIAEGATGVGLASLFKNADAIKGKNIVVIVSGSNINPDDVISIIG